MNDIEPQNRMIGNAQASLVHEIIIAPVALLLVIQSVSFLEIVFWPNLIYQSLRTPCICGTRR